MSGLLSDPDFLARFQAANPVTMTFINQPGGTGTYNQRIEDDGRTNRQFPNTALGQAFEEKARVGDQIRQNALSGTGSFMNKPHLNVEHNRNYYVEKAQSASLFGRAEAMFSGAESYIPAWLKSDPAIGLMVVTILYFLLFKSK